MNINLIDTLDDEIVIPEEETTEETTAPRNLLSSIVSFIIGKIVEFFASFGFTIEL